jgi:hypothetical protein
MSAQRVCACGAKLEEAGDSLICVGWGAEARSWRVLLNGKTVAAGTAPRHTSNADVAFTPGFEARFSDS